MNRKTSIAAVALSFLAVQPTWAAPSKLDPFTDLNKQVATLTNVAQGVVFVAAVMKISDMCQPKSSTNNAVRLSFGRLVQYAGKAVPRDQLAKAVGLGTQVSMRLKETPGFQCQTSGLAVRASEVPDLVDAEIKRSPNPHQFDINRISVIAR